MVGNVSKFDANRGFGFISRRGEPDVFFHVSDFFEQPQSIEIGDLLEFESVKTQKGLRAARIELIETEPDAEAAAGG